MMQNSVSDGDINQFCSFVKKLFGQEAFVPLHAPNIGKLEEESVRKVVESTFVSSVGKEVTEFENELANYLKVKHVVAMSSGTAALHIALLTSGVEPDTEVLTQSISFVATANAIRYCGADPVFVDVDQRTLSICPHTLDSWLRENVILSNGTPYNKNTSRRISACVPMHSFGFIGNIRALQSVCDNYNITIVEDAAESLGSKYGGIHAGTFGKCGAISFNGNKVITTGSGGALITNVDALAEKARHLSTTAKQQHRWEYIHDEVGYNYRMPNINAGLGLPQLSRLESLVTSKTKLAQLYRDYFSNSNIEFIEPVDSCEPNYWLCTLKLPSKQDRDKFLSITNDSGVMTRPVWKPLHSLAPFKLCQQSSLANTIELADVLVNIPSSATSID